MSQLEVTLAVRDTPINFKLTYDPSFHADVATRHFLVKNSYCEPEVVHLMARVLRPGDFAIDAGANIGFFTMVMSRLVGEHGRVIAFEPGVNNTHKLKENLALNGVTNVEVVEQPLWERHEKVSFHLMQDSGLNSIKDTGGVLCVQELQATSLYDYCKIAPRLIKLDVEGAEEYVLKGLHPQRHNSPPFIICEVYPTTLKYFNCTPESLRAAMKQHGYDTFIAHPDGAFPTLIPPRTGITRKHEQMNVLFSTIEAVAEAWGDVQLDENGRVAP